MKRDYQDGRASQAMFKLIDFVRQRKHEFGTRIDLLLIDNPSAEKGRDHYMAGRLHSALKKNSDRIFISLTGNIHNQVSLGNSFNDSYKPMGYHLVQMSENAEIITLNLVHTGGTAWVSTPDGFGVVELGGYDAGEGVELLDGWASDPVVGVIYLGEITASRPARELQEL